MPLAHADVGRLNLEMLPHLFQATQTEAASSHGKLFMITGSQKSLGFLTSLERVLTFVMVGHLHTDQWDQPKLGFGVLLE